MMFLGSWRGLRRVKLMLLFHGTDAQAAFLYVTELETDLHKHRVTPMQ